MTDFKTIHGKKIKFLTSDLSMSTATEGELFYSDQNREFKVGINVQAWAAGGSLNRGNRFGTGLGTQTAMVAASGAPPVLRATEEYDGSSWTNVNDMNADHFLCAGFGTLTAGVVAGGHKAPTPRAIATTEEYDGTDWSSVEDMPAGRQYPQGAGILTAGLVMGGLLDPPSTALATTFEYDGTNYADGGDMNNIRYGSNSAGGTQTAAWIVGGPGDTGAKTEEYNGTAWTEVNDIGTARYACAGCGPQTNAVIAGGHAADATGLNATETYDGTTWSDGPTIGTARYALYHSPAGTGSVAAIAGGGPGAKTDCEEFTGTITLKTVTDS